MVFGQRCVLSMISLSASAAVHLNGSAMKDDRDKCQGQTGKLAKKTLGKGPWQDRLKVALRENLKRRKSQARGRGDSTIAVSNDDEVLPYRKDGNKSGE